MGERDTHHGSVALVGRADEVRRLELCWARAREGDGNTVVVSGEPGIGKSRLAAELERRALADGAVVVRLQCSAADSNSELHPLRRHLSRFAGVQPADPDPDRLEKIKRLLALVPSGDRAEKLLDSLVAIDEQTTPRPDLRRSDDRLDALVEGFLELAALQSMLLVLDDAQWLDPTSNALLQRLVQRAPGSRLLLVVTARSGYDPGWIGTPHTSVVIPRRLSDADTLTLATAIAGSKGLSAADLQAIVTRSEGVPLFVEALAREKPGDGANTPNSSNAAGGFRGVLVEQIRNLGPAKQMAQIGAALGRSFTHDAAAIVAGTAATDVEQMLAELMATDILRTKPIAADATYTFRHWLYQEAAYASLAADERVALHARVAQVLGRIKDQDARPEILARHCDEAERYASAALNWLAAGKAAATRGAVIEATNFFKQGLVSAGHLPAGIGRDRLEFELDMNLGPALMARDGYASGGALEAFSRARELLHHSQSSLEETHVLLGLFNAHFGRGELVQAFDVARQADERLAVGYGGYPILMGQALCMMGRFSEARRCLVRGLAIYDPSLDAQSGLFCRVDVVATSFLAKVEFALGNLDRSRELTAGAMAMARQQGHPVALAIAYLGQLFLAAEEGDLDQAQAIADDALAHVTRYHLGNYRLWVGFTRAAFDLRTDPGRAMVEMRNILTEAQAAGTLMFRPVQLGLLGAAYSGAGELDDALALTDQGLDVARTTGAMEVAPALYRMRAKTLATTRPGEAIKDLEASLALAAQQSARIEQVRSATMLARMLEHTDKGEDARRMLGDILDTFPRSLKFRDLDQARRVLGAPGASTTK